MFTEDALLYIETHAGRGKFFTNDPGSPIVALNTIANHSSLPMFQSQGKTMLFRLYEIDEEYYSSLVEELGRLDIPPFLDVDPKCGDYQDFLREIRGKEASIYPAFLVLDPFDYDLPHDELAEFFRYPKSEMLITFMIRYIQLAARQAQHEGHRESLNRLYGSDVWSSCMHLSKDQIVECLISKYVQSFDPRYHSVIRMMGETRTLEYVLLHLTKHSRGREKFKEAMWKTFPDGNMVAYKASDPHQVTLLSKSPNYENLAQLLLTTFRGRIVSHEEYSRWLVSIDYLPKHFNEVCRILTKDGIISCEADKYIASHRPSITFPYKVPDVSQLFD